MTESLSPDAEHAVMKSWHGGGSVIGAICQCGREGTLSEIQEHIWLAAQERLTSPRMGASVEQGGGATRPDTANLPAAAAVAEPDPTEHVASVSVGVVAADREAFDSDGVEHTRQSRLSRWQEQR